MDAQANAGNSNQAANATENEAKTAVDKNSEDGKRSAKMTRSYAITMSVWGFHWR